MRRFMDYLSSVNTALTPIDIRERPDQYVHFVGGIASPGGGRKAYLTLGEQAARMSGGYYPSALGRASGMAGKAASTSKDAWTLGRVAMTSGTVAGIGTLGYGAARYVGSSASVIGSYRESLKPRPEYGGMSYQFMGGEHMGAGYLSGTGKGFIANIPLSAAEQARMYEKYSPVYQDVAVQTEWLKAQAKYEASLAYPMEYGQAVTTKTTDRRMPYRVRILD